MTETTLERVNGHAEPQVSLLKFAPETAVDEQPTEVEAVDRADNPLADWLTVPDQPLLPAWARRAFTGAVWSWAVRVGHRPRTARHRPLVASQAVRNAYLGVRSRW